jgi:hypothetical protein
MVIILGDRGDDRMVVGDIGASVLEIDGKGNEDASWRDVER